MVSRLVGASPEKTLLTLTPPSASRPRPSVRRDSTSALSRGRLVTTRRPDSFSYQRNAGTWALAPCSSPAWLAGVVAGNWACHSASVWLPERSHRASVGRLPDAIAQWASGAESPSI